MAKWRLFFTVLPFTLLFALAKLAIHRQGWEPWAFDSLTGALFGAATFVIAFVLSGTLSNYNASEDMVVQFVNAVESIEDVNRLAAASHSSYDGAPLRLQLAQLLGSTEGWLRNALPLEQLEQVFGQLNGEFAALRSQTEVSAGNRCLSELARMRILITRMHINRSTSFLGPAYAMLEIFLVGAVVALLLIGAERFSENLVVSCFLFTSFTYLLLLIRDLDNPFQYDGSSCVDVDLGMLTACRDRLLRG
ncbi:MAG: hypothetical protein ACK5FE_15280 [Cyanobacteriota bacterium]|jgi:hypothetical protein